MLSSKKVEDTPSVDNVAEVVVEENSESNLAGDEVSNIQTNIVEEVIVEEDASNVISEETTEALDTADKVVVEFLGESWVELKGKNKVYFQGVFHKGNKKEIDYVENLFISVGRPYNVKVLVKGVEKNIIAKRRKMNIPLDSL
jgi:hypothetical protein